jgi:hypothetical protein
MLSKLKVFIDQYNETPLKSKELDLQDYVDSFSEEWLTIWGQRTREPYKCDFRSSALGTHPFLLAWDYFHPNKEQAYSTRTMWKFATGYLFELHLSAILHKLQYTFDTQRSIVYQLNEFTVGGHLDYVIEDEGIIETKCVNDAKFKQWRKAGHVDDHRYSMQLALYCTRLQMPGIFVVCNVDTGELAYYDLDFTKFEASILAAVAQCYYIKQCPEWWMTLEKISPPNPLQRKDSTHYLPPYMYQSKGVLHPACCIYDYEQLEGKYYVNGYNYPTEAKQWEPEL